MYGTIPVACFLFLVVFVSLVWRTLGLCLSLSFFFLVFLSVCLLFPLCLYQLLLSLLFFLSLSCLSCISTCLPALALSGFLSFTVSSVILSAPLVCVAAYSLTSLMVLLSPWKSPTVTVCCCLGNISSIICCCHELCLRSVSLSSHSTPPSSSLLSPSLSPCCVSLGIYCCHMISLVSYPSAWKLVQYFRILA